MLNSFRSSIKYRNLRFFTSSATRYVSVGDHLPSVSLFRDSPGNAVDLASDLIKGNAIIVGVPGAFSPACSASHVPGYITNLGAFKEKGISKVVVVSVNDPFVTKAWSQDLYKDNPRDEDLSILADPRAEFSEALDLTFDANKVFGNQRSKRYALVLKDGNVAKTFIEPDNTSINVSDASNVLKNI